MTMFEQPMLHEEPLEEQAGKPPAASVKRPPRWSPSNWPVRWKVLAIVLVPTVLAVAFGGMRIYDSLTEASDAHARTAAIRDAVIVLAVIVVALALMFLAAGSLVKPLRRLRTAALRVAHEDLPAELTRVQAGEEPPHFTPIPVYTTEEIGQVAHAVDELHEQALLLAGEQTRLQMQISDMFETLSRRNRSLVDQQLALIDDLERNEDDPQRLDALFKLDHLAARMRRNGANLLVLSGAQGRREQTDPLPVASIINAAASQVEDYQRVVTETVPDSSIVGAAAGDMVHLLAELIDNALRYSPPTRPVQVSAVRTDNRGLVIEVRDTGLGMAEGDLRMANIRSGSGAEVTPYTARHMGLFVVGRLAQQHGLVVQLRSSRAGDPRSGTTVTVFVPAELLEGVATEWPVLEDGFDEGIDEGVAFEERFDEPSVATPHSDSGLLAPFRNGSAPRRGVGAAETQPRRQRDRRRSRYRIRAGRYVVDLRRP